MRKIFVTAITVLIIVPSVWYYSSERDNASTVKKETPKPNYISPSSNAIASNKEIPRNQSDISKKNIKVTASSPEEAGVSATDFYMSIASFYTLQNGSMTDVYSGESINVNNFYLEEDPPSEFVPLFSDGKIVALSIYREFTKGEKKLGRMSKINEEWYTYPPVLLQDAEQQLISIYPSLGYKVIYGYYFIEDGGTPYYLFENLQDSEENRFFLVSAHDKSIATRSTRKLKEIEEEPLPLKFNQDGFMEIVPSMVTELTDDELDKLKSDIALTNKYIKDGVMRFDKDMNVIYDGRKKGTHVIYDDRTDSFVIEDD